MGRMGIGRFNLILFSDQLLPFPLHGHLSANEKPLENEPTSFTEVLSLIQMTKFNRLRNVILSVKAHSPITI